MALTLITIANIVLIVVPMDNGRTLMADLFRAIVAVIDVRNCDLIRLLI